MIIFTCMYIISLTERVTTVVPVWTQKVMCLRLCIRTANAIACLLTAETTALQVRRFRSSAHIHEKMNLFSLQFLSTISLCVY